jgi:hypothetical protein
MLQSEATLELRDHVLSKAVVIVRRHDSGPLSSYAAKARAQLLAAVGLEKAGIIPKCPARVLMGVSRGRQPDLARRDISGQMIGEMVGALKGVKPPAGAFKHTWSEEDHQATRRLAEAGHTAGEIALALNVTEHAAKAGARRLGVRITPDQPPCVERRGNRQEHEDPLPLPDLGAIEGADISHARPWLERQEGQCAWPVKGDGLEVWSCCAPVATNLTRRHHWPHLGQYCAAHMAALYRDQAA